MSRIFPNFLESFEEYANDKFCPPQFLTWSALSIIAGALERKVWLPWSDTYSFYPNIYAIMVSKPGTGKSVSLDKALQLLIEVNRKTQSLNIMPNQVTEAKFLELMGSGRSFMDKSSGRDLTIFQNAGYYFASEASMDLRDIFGSFIACLTGFYDCPTLWKKATKGSGELTLKNVCMNLLAASTFDYLGKLVSDENIQGGFASRLLYVIDKEPSIKVQTWQSGMKGSAAREEFRAALVSDLTAIHKMTGPMHATPEFAKAWEDWHPKFQAYKNSLASEKLQSIIARTNTSVFKISMLLSAAESDDRTLKIHHFEKAIDLVEGLNKNIPDIFREAKAAQGPGRPGTGLANQILKVVLATPGISQEALAGSLAIMGHSKGMIESVISGLKVDGILGAGSASVGGISLIVKGNPNKYL